jgi:hypothetical protein
MMDGPSLPRSIRWRLQLGLLALPSSEKDAWSTEELYAHNASLLRDQRTRYQQLVEKYEVHHESTTEEEEDKPEAALAERSDEAATAAALDPLTAIVREQEAQAKRRRELELKYRKERARRNRGIYQGESESPTNSGTDAVRVPFRNDYAIQPYSLLSHCTETFSRWKSLIRTCTDYSRNISRTITVERDCCKRVVTTISIFPSRSVQLNWQSYYMFMLGNIQILDIDKVSMRLRRTCCWF